jgi:uncharacterized protein
MKWRVAWDIKSSKLCNLRCRYCYEWEELARRERITAEQWSRILVAARRYHQLQHERFGEPGQTVVVWHGGEPLLLPPTYFEAVLALQRQEFGWEALELRNILVTNLYAVSDKTLDLLAGEGFELRVSLDCVPGVRLSRRGEETEKRVRHNLSRVLERKIPVIALVVLAGHTRGHLREIHDFYADLGLEFGLTPLFEAPLVSPQAPFAVTDDAVVDALDDLFTHWLATGCRIRVDPLWQYLVTVLQRMTGLTCMTRDRRQVGETRLTVNTDGEVYQPHDRYVPGRSLGNVFEQSMDEILASPAYRASLDRDAVLFARHCERCRYQGACDGEPVLSVPHHWRDGPCPIAARVSERIEAHLREEGYDESALRRRLPLEELATATLGAG